MTPRRLWRSPLGWVFAALYVLAFTGAYVDYLGRRGTWMADLLLDVLAMPYILVGRLLTLDPTFELHGFQPWGLVPALIFCAALAYLLGLGLERAFAWIRRRWRSR
jgi:hypothetical protein